MKKEFKAFTIVEVMVAMAITAIIVSLSFYGLKLLQLQYEQYKKQQEEIADTRRCLLLLQWDTENTRYMNHFKNELFFFSSTDTIVYLFLEDKTIRSYGLQHLDSFNVQIAINRVKNETNSASNLINNIELSILQTGFIKQLTLSKTYSAADLINWENEY